MVEQSGEPFLSPFFSCLPHTAQSLGHSFPALCRARAGSTDVLLDSHPSLPNLRGRLLPFVRLVHRCRVGGGALSRPSAGHRPPLKRGVQFSRAPLSRRLIPPRRQGGYQSHQVHKPVLSVQSSHRQRFPAVVPPTAKTMRPDPAHYPTVESVEELSDVGSLIVMTPPPQY